MAFASFLINHAADAEILKIGMLMMRYLIDNVRDWEDAFYALGITGEFTYYVVRILDSWRNSGDEEEKLYAAGLLSRIIKETAGWGKTIALRIEQEYTMREIEDDDSRMNNSADKAEAAEPFTSIPDENALVCSTTFANWMKEQYRKDEEAPSDNLDMILRYCGPWSEAFFDEKKRQIDDFYYSLKLENGEITMAPSYPLTYLYASEPVDFEKTPEYQGFASRMPLLTTAAAFPGKQQYPYMQDAEWTLRNILDEVLHIAETFRQNPDFEDHFSRREFYQAAEPGFIDNKMPYSYGPSCPDRLLSDMTYRNVMMHFLRDFKRICAEAGIRMEYEGLFYAALCAAWYGRMRQYGIRDAQSLKLPFGDVLQGAQQLYDAHANIHEGEKEKLESYTQAVSEVTERITHISVIDPPEEGDGLYLTKEAKEAALRNKERALWEYMTPQERVNGNWI